MGCTIQESIHTWKSQACSRTHVSARCLARFRYTSSSEGLSSSLQILSPVQVVGTKAGEGPASYDILSKISNSALLAYGDAAHGAIFQHSLSAAAAISNFLDSEFE